jgi:hypothetical protein
MPSKSQGAQGDSVPLTSFTATISPSFTVIALTLAFAFKSYLLDSKQFKECATIRDKFRTEFLQIYFGSNPAIQDVGEELVLAGELTAAKSVNRAVKVLGATLDLNLLIRQLSKDFPLCKVKAHIFAHTEQQKLFKSIKHEPNSEHLYYYCNQFFLRSNISYQKSVDRTYIVKYQGKTLTLASHSG